MANLIIRDFENSDISSIVDIAKESFTKPWSAKSFLEELKQSKTVFKVAQVDEEIVGYIIVRVILDEAEILSLAVRKSFRRKGIATALLKETILKLRGNVSSIYLEVRISNHEAINLYKNFGFKEYGIRKNYYLLPKEDALLMKLEL